MDERTTPTEPVTTTPDPVVVDTQTIEPPQAEPAQAPTEPISTPPETPVPSEDAATGQAPQTEPVSEPIETLPEPPTAQMGRNEPLPQVTPEPAPQGTAAPEVEALTPTATPIPSESPSEMTPPTTEELPRTPPPSQSQQGTAQPEPTPQPTPMPAQAQFPPPQNIVGLILTKARAVIQLRKQKKLIKIMGLFLKQTSITNDAVEKLLHVSDATATRYLSELEKQGKITQGGKTGHAVTYTKR